MRATPGCQKKAADKKFQIQNNLVFCNQSQQCLRSTEYVHKLDWHLQARKCHVKAPHMHTTKFFLTSSLVLVRVCKEQVFPCNFSLISLVFSCVRLDTFSLMTIFARAFAIPCSVFFADRTNARTIFLVPNLACPSFWTRLLVKEKHVNLCCTHNQIIIISFICHL